MTKENAEIAANQNHSITNSLNFNHNPSYHTPIIPVGDIHRLQQDSPALADRIVGLLEKEQIHRQELEKKVVTLEERGRSREKTIRW